MIDQEVKNFKSLTDQQIKSLEYQWVQKIGKGTWPTIIEATKTITEFGKTPVVEMILSRDWDISKEEMSFSHSGLWTVQMTRPFISANGSSFDLKLGNKLQIGGKFYNYGRTSVV